MIKRGFSAFRSRSKIGRQSFQQSHHISKTFSSIHQEKDSNHVLNFTDPVVSFKTKSSFQLLRSIAVFTICQFRPLVVRSDKLLKISYRLLGPYVTNIFLRSTFFNHFCAGEDEKTIKPTVDYLHENGIGSILDYAAEADIGDEKIDTEIIEQRLKDEPLGRVYDYEGEELCDERLETFKQCILAVHAVSPTGFAAIKCTALGNPQLLERMSVAIVELRNLFEVIIS